MTTLNKMNAQIEVLERAIEDKQGEICTAQNEIDNFEYECSEDEFDEFLDEVYGDVTICGMTYSSSYALKDLDPVAYNCGKSEYESNYDLDSCEEYTDMVEQLESLNEQLEELESELEELQDELDSLENDQD